MGKRITRKSKLAFAQALKAWRARKGYSQAQATEALGLPSIDTLQNWEIARTKPSGVLEAMLLKPFARD